MRAVFGADVVLKPRHGSAINGLVRISLQDVRCFVQATLRKDLLECDSTDEESTETVSTLRRSLEGTFEAENEHSHLQYLS
jgi:hypothetical protein